MMRDNIKKLLWITTFIALSVYAENEKDRIGIYLDFEEAYMSNNAYKLNAWLSDNYKVTQTLHVPGIGSDSRTVSKEQLLAAMKSIGRPSEFPRSTETNTVIESVSENAFCASSTTTNQTVVGGKDYEEKEVRRVCFSGEGEKYLATSHKIDIYYREL
jgi:hypothetical protein